MKKFIRYLYEYQNGKRIRNVGFVRVEETDDSAVIQIYGQGFPVKGNQALEVFPFYLVDKQVIGIAMGEIQGTKPVFGYRLMFTAEDVGGKEIFGKLEGLIIRKRGARGYEWYAAVWNEHQFNVEEMKSGEDVERRKWEKAPEKPDLPKNIELPGESGEPKRIEPPEPSKESMDMESSKQPEESGEIETPEKTEEAMELELSGQPETPEMPDPSTSTEPEPEIKKTVYKDQIFKISRQNMVQLPRKEWRLANNHFLLHGYHNYHHLVSFKKDGRCWLGVPGIYHPREEMAAAAFGFRQFMKPNEGEIELTKEEKSADENFGYWCREISNVVKTRSEENEKGTY